MPGLMMPGPMAPMAPAAAPHTSTGPNLMLLAKIPARPQETFQAFLSRTSEFSLLPQSNSRQMLTLVPTLPRAPVVFLPDTPACLPTCGQSSTGKGGEKKKKRMPGKDGKPVPEAR